MFKRIKPTFIIVMIGISLIPALYNIMLSYHPCDGSIWPIIRVACSGCGHDKGSDEAVHEKRNSLSR